MLSTDILTIRSPSPDILQSISNDVMNWDTTFSPEMPDPIAKDWNKVILTR